MFLADYFRQNSALQAVCVAPIALYCGIVWSFFYIPGTSIPQVPVLYTGYLWVPGNIFLGRKKKKKLSIDLFGKITLLGLHMLLYFFFLLPPQTVLNILVLLFRPFSSVSVGYVPSYASGGGGSGGDGAPSAREANSISRAYSVLER